MKTNLKSRKHKKSACTLGSFEGSKYNVSEAYSPSPLGQKILRKGSTLRFSPDVLNDQREKAMRSSNSPLSKFKISRPLQPIKEAKVNDQESKKPKMRRLSTVQ